ncbi:hypothetical protein ETB97_008854 [Aspergillus alliaceus]|uniref:Methyltransferase type 12 domain-containing protein n=1 Tax=Petromyces alliaceus TaxID=209559 RepID=A0A8H6E108_PETAA|nr:hypothetical protein ETB97_008854 [Aspergillus burnettii]
MASTSDPDDYVLGRGINDSIRLEAQHLLWKLHKGYDLHPHIPIKRDMKIAELGTGTAVWLFDLARGLPPTVQLHGYDISDRQYPPKDLWPPNVALGLMDSLTDPPPSLKCQYDVVHLRMWASNLGQRDTTTLIQHIKHLLKPGGYVQWEDADLIHQVIKGSRALEFEQKMQKTFHAAGLDYRQVFQYLDFEGKENVRS